MTSKRKAAFILFYVCVILLMLFTYLYIQKYYSHEVTHDLSGLMPYNSYSAAYLRISVDYSFKRI